MKTDAQLHRDIVDELEWDPMIREKEIGVAVSDGVVTLSGSVASYAEKFAVERGIERIAGVKAVANELEVRLPSASFRTDTDIAHKVVEALQWDVLVPDQKILARVTDGWVTLEGEVEWDYQKQAALKAIRNLTGVRGVRNLIKVTPTFVSPFDVSQKIKDALRRRADREASRITVTAENNVVTLKGQVPTFADRRAVEGAAWSAPGVRDVRDEIDVAI